MDGALLEAWASVKSLRPKDEAEPPAEGGGHNPEVDFRGQRRRNDTHQSTTDPEARLARKRKGKETKPCFSAHALMDNREGWWGTCLSRLPAAHQTAVSVGEAGQETGRRSFRLVKTVAGGRKLRCCGVERNRFWMEMTTAGYNLARLAKLIPAAG